MYASKFGIFAPTAKIPFVDFFLFQIFGLKEKNNPKEDFLQWAQIFQKWKRTYLKISDYCGTGFYLRHRTEPTNGIYTAYFIIISFHFIKLITNDSRFYLYKYHLLYVGS